MAFSRQRYEKLIVLSVTLSTGFHLLLAFIPDSVGEWVIGPPRLRVYASRFEVVTLAREPVPRYVTSTTPDPTLTNQRSIVPPVDSLRLRPTAADSAVLLVAAAPNILSVAAQQGKYLETPFEESVEDMQIDSSSLVQAYISTVLNLVHSRRYYPEAARRLGQEGEVLLAFSIDRRGLLDGEVELLRPCRYRLLNRSACKCIERAAPFPPLPAPVLDNILSLKIKLLYRLTD